MYWTPSGRIPWTTYAVKQRPVPRRRRRHLLPRTSSDSGPNPGHTREQGRDGGRGACGPSHDKYQGGTVLYLSRRQAQSPLQVSNTVQ